MWFRGDDRFPTHPKVLAIPRDRRAAAVGVWYLSAVWSAGALSDGFVPDHILAEMVPDADKYRHDLVASGLWIDGVRSNGHVGIQFHDWSDYNPLRVEVEKEKQIKAARQRRYRERRSKPDGDA